MSGPVPERDETYGESSLDDGATEYLEGEVRMGYQPTLDRETWELAETLGARDGVTPTEAVRRAIHAAAKGRAS